jgi:hypothetical protein
MVISKQINSSKANTLLRKPGHGDRDNWEGYLWIPSPGVAAFSTDSKLRGME